MKIRAILAVLALLFSGAAFATSPGVWTNVTVSLIQPCTSYYCPSPGYVEVEFSAASTTGPNCSSSYRSWVAIDVSTPTGAFAAAVLQSAHLSGATVTVTGANSCQAGVSLETLAYVQE